MLQDVFPTIPGAYGHQRLETRRQAPPMFGPRAINRRPAMLPLVPTDEQLLLAVGTPGSDQLHTSYIRTRKRRAGAPRVQSNARRHISIRSAREIFCD